MGEYKFYQDRKVTSWERDYFSVKADSYEEAEAIGLIETMKPWPLMEL